MEQVHGRSNHTQTQGKIERYHSAIKNVVKLDNYHEPEELEKTLENFVNIYHNEKYRQWLQNLMPAAVCYGRGDEILKERERLKKNRLLTNEEMHIKNFKNYLPTIMPLFKIINRTLS